MKTLPPKEPYTYEEQAEALRRDLAALQQKYDHLKQIYDKLAGQWNAFQATAKPEQRFMYRAEAAGEVARKLAEVFLGLAYGTGSISELVKILQELDDRQNATVEVGGKLVPHRG